MEALRGKSEGVMRCGRDGRMLRVVGGWGRPKCADEAGRPRDTYEVRRATGGITRKGVTFRVGGRRQVMAGGREGGLCVGVVGAWMRAATSAGRV